MVTVIFWIKVLSWISVAFFALAIIFTLSRMKRVRRYVKGQKQALLDKIEGVTLQYQAGAKGEEVRVGAPASRIVSMGKDAPGTYVDGVFQGINSKLNKVPNKAKVVQQRSATAALTERYVYSDGFKRVQPGISV